MAAIIDRGPTRGFTIVFRDPSGKQHWVKVDGGRKAAEGRKNEIIADVVALRQSGEIHWKSPEQRARLTVEAEERARDERVTVSAYAERWLEVYAKPKTRQRVFTGYAAALRNVWVPAIGDVELRRRHPAPDQRRGRRARRGREGREHDQERA